MAGLPTILSNAFQLPVPTATGVAGMQQQNQQAPSIGSPAEGIQAVDGITQEYFTKWNDIQSFANEMNSYGIDVTKPDWRNQEAVDAHMLYKKMMADVQYQGQRLKNSQKMLEKFAQAKLSAHGADIQYGGDLGQTFDISQVDNTGMTDVQKQQAMDARQGTTIDAANARQESSNRVRINQNKLNRDLTREIAKIKDETARKKIKDKTAPYAGLYNEIASALSTNNGWTQSTVVNDAKMPMLENNIWNGAKLGTYEDIEIGSKGQEKKTVKPRIIRGLIKDPSTNEVFVTFQGNAAPEVLDTENLEGLVKSYSESNRGFNGGDAMTFFSMAEDIKPVEVATTDPKYLKEAEKIKIKAEKDAKELDSINRSWIGGEKVYTINGADLVIDREGDGWGSYLRIKSGGDKLGLSKNEINGKYTSSEITDLLHNLGYYKAKDGTTVISKPAPSTQPQDTTKAVITKPSTNTAGMIGQEYKTPEYQAMLKGEQDTLKTPEGQDAVIMDVAKTLVEDVDVVAEAMKVYLSLGNKVERVFYDWYEDGGREIGKEGVAKSQQEIKIDTSRTDVGTMFN